MTQSDHAIDLAAYGRRIGYEGRFAPESEVLMTLVQKHMATIVFEAIDVLLGRGIDLTPAAIDRKMLLDHRGGYCFEHASLMRRVLEASGFRVTQYLARVLAHRSPSDPAGPATHSTLRVEGGGGCWLVDVGFGGFMPNQPLEWRVGEEQHTLFGSYRIMKTHDGFLLESGRGNRRRALYEIFDLNWQEADFKVANHYTSSHPDSLFCRNLIVVRTEASVRRTLAGNRLRHSGPAGLQEERWLTADELAESLALDFDLPVQPDWLPLLERVAAEGGPPAEPK